MSASKGILIRLLPISNLFFKRYCSRKSIRNIGILAHIDAGKTTTTERMLFYSGKTRSLGEVHHGNTVTDCMTLERERGITICSSAVTFPWKETKINLLDTPGHIDFTMEVEQSLHAVDGVILVLDGTAGVEAQTMTVWEQAQKHKLPTIVFVNKMDRPDANFEECIQDLKTKLEALPISVQYPDKDTEGNLSLFDIIELQKITWNPENLGRSFKIQKINTESDAFDSINEKRNALIDCLSGIDDELAEFVISKEGFDQVDNEQLRSALRRSTCQNKVIPVLLGSAYKNIGVQKLIDAILEYLPAPHERNQLYDCFENDFVGKVFKITHDKQRGPLTLVRVFRGEMKKGMRIVSSNGKTEIVSKIYEPLADEYRETDVILAGDVGICAGLKNTITGTLLTASTVSLKNAQHRLRNLIEKPGTKINSITITEHNSDTHEQNDLLEEIFSTEPHIPDAVYFCSIEPPSLSSQNAMELALKQLQREDPSLRVSFNEITAQTVLGGMGELHMEVIKSRILNDYKIDVDLGPLQIAYKETIDAPAKDSFSLEKEIAGSKQSVAITLELVKDHNELFSLVRSAENAINLNALRPRTIQVIRKGVLSALERGPRVGGQVVETQVCLHNVSIGRNTADSFVMAAAAQCVQKILNTIGTRLLEPIMSLQITAPSEKVSTILADLSRRRAIINDVLPKTHKNKVLLVNAPLAELGDYSSVLRVISSGTANMTMQPSGFSNMNCDDEEIAIRRAQGFE